MQEKISLEDIKNFKGRRKISMLTAYDFPFAAALDKAGLDLILIGDSVANVVLGLESTKEVGMEEMIYHAKAVSRAVKRAYLIGDMPYEAYQVDAGSSVKNARRFVNEAGCDAVKLEWFDSVVEVSSEIVKAGIPVMGHIGLTPQTADKLGGFKVQGRDAETALKLIKQAEMLESVGCFAILLECVPDKVSQIITKALKVPTIGIGAGPFCDGQVLVTHDMLGLFERYRPKFVKEYIKLSDIMVEAFVRFKEDVLKGTFPDKEHSFIIKEEELKKIIENKK